MKKTEEQTLFEGFKHKIKTALENSKSEDELISFLEFQIKKFKKIKDRRFYDFGSVFNKDIQNRNQLAKAIDLENVQAVNMNLYNYEKFGFNLDKEDVELTKTICNLLSCKREDFVINKMI
jgi:hypothetical protein